jgi:tetratricopeptide (TPR) repeat protein
VLDQLPEGNQRLRAELALRTIESAVAYVWHGGASQERERPIRRMCELGEKLGERDQLLRGLIALAVHHWVGGELLLGQELAKRNLDLAEATQDPRLLVEAHHYAGMMAFSCGNLRQALTYLDDALRHASAASLDDKVSPLFGTLYKSRSTSNLAQLLQLLGSPDEALKSAEQALRLARDSRHLFSLAVALIAPGGTFRSYRREPEIALVQAKEAIALSQENGFSDWLNWGRFYQGWASADLGQPEQGIAEMEAADAGFRQNGGAPFQQYRIALIAQAYARTSRTDEALTMLNEALTQIERTGERVDHAEILRLKGEVLLMHDRSATVEAENCFRTGLAIARQQEAKWWELRATVSLARLLRDTNRRDEACSILAEIYTWFTEGFDLPDLKDAKSLLDELRREHI